MRALGIHNISASDTDPVSFVSLAALAGCEEVSAFTQLPNDKSPFPVVTRDNVALMKTALADNNIRLANVDAFTIAPGTELDSLKDGLEIGAELGARHAVTMVYDNDELRLIDSLNQFCDVAAELGMKAAIEFLALMPMYNTLASVAELISRVGHANLGIGIDLLHLVRSGGTPADIGKLDPNIIAYAQLCDGAHLDATSDYASEAVSGRLIPGDGVFPVREFLRALPHSTPLDIEVPQLSELPVADRITHAVQMTRQLISSDGARVMQI